MSATATKVVTVQFTAPVGGQPKQYTEQMTPPAGNIGDTWHKLVQEWQTDVKGAGSAS